MKDWTIHDGSRGVINSKGIYNVLIPSLMLGAGWRLGKPLGLGSGSCSSGSPAVCCDKGKRIRRQLRAGGSAGGGRAEVIPRQSITFSGQIKKRKGEAARLRWG